MSNLSDVRYIFIDADQTLLDFSYSERYALKSAVEHYNIEFTDRLYNDYSAENLHLWKLLEKGEITKNQLQPLRFENLMKLYGIEGVSPSDMNDCYISAFSECGKTLDEAEKLCKILSKCFKLYITTNGTEKPQRSRLKNSGLLPYVEEVFVSDAIGFNKPASEFFNFCFNRIGDLNKERYIMFGDSMSADMLGGKNAGIKTCLFDPEDKVKMPDTLCDYKVTKLLDFPKLFDIDV